MKSLAILSGLLLVSATQAEVSFRYIPGSIGPMSSDARVFATDLALYRDFVAVPLPPPPGFQAPPQLGPLSHDGNVLITYVRVSQFETLYYIYEGDPPVITQANFYESAPNDECGDIPLESHGLMFDGSGHHVISNRSYVGDNQCGYVASGGRQRAIEWDRSTGTSSFLFLPTDVPGVTPGIAASKMSISAAGISSDGSTVVGSIAPNGARWDQIFVWKRGVGVSFPINDGIRNRALNLSRDATAIVGTVDTGPNSGSSNKPALWVDGQMTRLDLEPGASAFNRFDARAVSNGGSIVVGRAQLPDFSTYEAVYWDASGLHLVKDLVPASQRAEFCGFLFQDAIGVTDDGTTLIGRGRTASGALASWIVRLTGEPLPYTTPLRTTGDTNGDRHVDGADLSALLSSFGTTITPGATPDLNCDGFINAADLSVLLGAFGT